MHGNKRSRAFLNETVYRIHDESSFTSPDFGDLKSAIVSASTELAKLRFKHPAKLDDERAAKVAFLNLMLDRFDAKPKELRSEIQPNLTRMKLYETVFGTRQTRIARLIGAVPDLPGLVLVATKPSRSLTQLVEDISQYEPKDLTPAVPNLIEVLKRYSGTNLGKASPKLGRIIRVIGEIGAPAVEAIPVLLDHRDANKETVIAIAKLHRHKRTDDVEQWLEERVKGCELSLKHLDRSEMTGELFEYNRDHLLRVISTIENALEK